MERVKGVAFQTVEWHKQRKLDKSQQLCGRALHLYRQDDWTCEGMAAGETGKMSKSHLMRGHLVYA